MTATVRGCCSDCGGTGVTGDPAVPGGKCWDCRGSGHPHAGICSILAEAEQRMLLERAVAERARRGAEVAYMSSAEAVLVQPGRRCNHVLHAILSIFTFGFWLWVWLFVGLYCAAHPDRRMRLSVDEYGTFRVDGHDPNDVGRPAKRETNPAVTWVVVGGIAALIILFLIAGG